MHLLWFLVFIFGAGETSKQLRLEVLPDSEWELVKNFELILKLMSDYSTTPKESPEVTVRSRIISLAKTLNESSCV